MDDQENFSALFAERSLWQLYRQSAGFYRNRFNVIVVLLGGLLLVGFAVAHFFRLGGAAVNRLDFPGLFSSWANAGLPFAATILGFVLAGFTILFAVLRPETAAALWGIKRTGQHLNELKLMLVTFVNVFVHYLTFVFLCAAYLIMGGKDGLADMIGRYLGMISPVLPMAITHLFFVAWGTWFIVIILKLKSFIYNLYQILLLGFADQIQSLSNGSARTISALNFYGFIMVECRSAFAAHTITCHRTKIALFVDLAVIAWRMEVTSAPE